jgi:SNF2 family DNA or RNA helicase
MLLLHAAWLPRSAAASACPALWGETNAPEPARKPKGRRAKAASPHHPFSATAESLKKSLPVPELKWRDNAAALIARLPTAGGEPQPSRPLLRERAAGGRSTLAGWSVPALTFPAGDALSLLINLSAGDSTPGLALAADARYWQTAARFALELIVGQRYAPALVEEDGGWAARWRPLLDSQSDQQRFDQLARAMPPSARALARAENDPEPGPRALLTDFVNAVVDAFARDWADFGKRKLKARPAPAQLWLDALVDKDPTVELPASFVEQYKAWSQPTHAGDGAFRLCFRLDPPETRAAQDLFIPRANSSDWALGYFLQASDDPSLLVPAETVWRERGSTLKYLKRKFDQPQERMLAGLGLASRIFQPIEGSLKHARPDSCALTADQAHAFIREAALLLQASGFGVLLPGLNAKLGVKLKLGSKKDSRTSPKGGVAGLTLDSIVNFEWELALGDQPLSREEFERLAALKVPLVQIRGQWVELRPEQLQQALDFLEKREKEGALSLDEALRMALAPDSVGGLLVTGVETGGWIGDLIRRMTDHAQLTPLPPPEDFVGQLRHYQTTGFSWLTFLRQFGLGACLADDMGLGKTIQTLALLLHLKHLAGKKMKPALLVCPTSVVNNWQREAARFAPSLNVLVHHGLAREKENFAKEAARHDLVLTSYSLLHRDSELLSGVKWGEVILDEAQNVKNPDTHQARAARKLEAQHRIALTGTPIENRLTELWSIFQFLNPGYFGSQESFRSNFARPIERMQDPEASRRLKALAGPFILRRLKTDPKVISDLPAKNEMKVFCPLTREQATLYEAVVRDSLRQIEEADGIQRRGLVLATLLRLKQVSNHPAHFLGDGSALPDRSGKLNRLVEMLEEAREVKDRALVFTQFAEMGEMLKQHLQTISGDEVLFLHGGVPAKKRAEMVERFQDDPHGPLVFILSIKAGGTGLNLTRASHVFHFDRWWNPAVENQATDRAFRIGQKKNVQVYKFVCAGTVEERIDEMIERKLALAQSIVGASEAWITELSTEQLRELFTLRKEAIPA